MNIEVLLDKTHNQWRSKSKVLLVHVCKKQICKFSIWNAEFIWKESKSGKKLIKAKYSTFFLITVYQATIKYWILFNPQNNLVKEVLLSPSFQMNKLKFRAIK